MTRSSVRRITALLVTAAITAGCGKKSSPPEYPDVGAELRADWARAIAGSSFSAATDVAVAANGSAFVAGRFEGSVRLGDATVSAAGAGDGYVAAIDASGNVRWEVTVGGRGADVVHALAASPDGGVVVAGTAIGPASIAGKPVAARGGPGAFVAKLSAEGEAVWVTDIVTDDHASLTDVAIAADGSAVAVGFFSGTASAGDHAVSSGGGHDALIIRLAPDGAPLWTRRAGGKLGDHANAVAINGKHTAIVGGFATRADIGGVEVLANNHNQDGFLLFVDDEGATRGVSTFGGDGRDVATGVAVDDSGRAHITGTYSGTATFGGPELIAGAGSAVFVAVFDDTGAHQWSRRLMGAGADASDIALFSDGMLVAGTFTGERPVGASVLRAAGKRDGYLAFISASGKPRWATRAGGAGHDAVSSIAASGETVIAAGSFAESARVFGKGVEAMAHHDGFVAKLSAVD